MGLVNKSEKHFRAIKGFMEWQGLKLVKRLTDIPPEAAIAEISEGMYDIDLVIARELTCRRDIDPITRLTVPNPYIQIVDCGADYLGVNLTRDRRKIAKHEIMPTQTPCYIDSLAIDRRRVYLVPDGVQTLLDRYVEQLREFVLVPS